MSVPARAQPRQPATAAKLAQTLPASPPLPPAVERMVARMLAPIHNAPAGKRRDDWTREEREAALLLAPPDCSRLTAAERDAVGAAVRAFEAMLAPAGPELIIEWLLPFGLAVRNAQSRQEWG